MALVELVRYIRPSLENYWFTVTQQTFLKWMGTQTKYFVFKCLKKTCCNANKKYVKLVKRILWNYSTQSTSYKPTPSIMKKWTFMRGTIEQYFTVSVHLKSDLIIVMAFCGRGGFLFLQQISLLDMHRQSNYCCVEVVRNTIFFELVECLSLG